MKFKLKEIEGVLVEELDSNYAWASQTNSKIQQQGERWIEVDIDKLYEIIAEESEFENAFGNVMNIAQVLAKAMPRILKGVEG